MRGSIALQLLLFATLLASLTTAVVGTLSYVRARRALEREAHHRLMVLARDMGERLHRELADRVADITNWSGLKLMRAMLYHDVDKELALFLRQAIGTPPLYAGLACVGADGTVVASAGESPTSAPGGLLRLRSPIPHPDQPGATIGTLVALLDRGRLLAALETSADPAAAPFSIVLRTARGEVVVEDVHDAGERGGAMLSGTAAVERVAGADLPALEIHVAEPARIALADVFALRATLLEVGALALLMSCAVGALVAWRISAPIGRLTESVRGIAQRRQIAGAPELPRASGEVGVLAAAFRSMLDELHLAQQEALAQSRRAFLGEVAANIAHEVRTPLSVLKTSAQLLARQQLPAAEQQQLAANVTAEVERLNRVVTNLVDLARPTRTTFRREPLAAIVERAVVFFAPQLSRLRVTLHRDPIDPTRHVLGNADQLHQVLLNVIHNALQSMAGPGTLDIRCRSDDGWDVLTVTDSGPGFPAETLAHPFSPFASTRSGGTGLGLTISKRIVEEHGGTLAIANAPAAGAEVRIRLPAARTREG